MLVFYANKALSFQLKLVEVFDAAVAKTAWDSTLALFRANL